jgi:hypothetical protein
MANNVYVDLEDLPDVDGEETETLETRCAESVLKDNDDQKEHVYEQFLGDEDDSSGNDKEDGRPPRSFRTRTRT